ncbi:hypothetical protein [Clostridium diolis]|uniref:hypothetical protein n=1 Tax=Clostridium diolis TaxID=223919 RepID=UPI003AF4E4FE
MAENTTLQIRISAENKDKIKQLTKEKGYKDTTEYIIAMCCNDVTQSCNDTNSYDLGNDINKPCNDNYLRLYYDLLPKYNYLKTLFDERISIFDDDFDLFTLGSFLWNIDFIKEFRKHYSSEWKNDDSFESLLIQLKKVYHLAYDAKQKTSIRLHGYIEKSLSDEYRAIPKENNLLCDDEV